MRALAELAHDRPVAAMNLHYLYDSLRIEPEQLEQTRPEEIAELLAEPVRGRARRFLLQLRRDLQS